MAVRLEPARTGEIVIEEEGAEALAVAADPKDLPVPGSQPLLTLAIETSCDETSVAVLRGEREVLANVVSSQVELHESFGGIVPELASRAHVRAVNPVIAESLRNADITLWDVDMIAVTVGPGLIGSLIVGVAAAKSLASVLDVPLVGVNHLEAHMYAALLEHPEASPPLIALIVSGGHSLLVHMIDHGIYEVLGQTLDDAAGEAFDKVARFLGLGYPGGPAIDALSENGDANAVKFPRPIKDKGYDFSFSGLKTAVVNHVKRQKLAGQEINVADIAASFQEAAVDVQVTKTVRAAVDLGIPSVVVCGGVAANSRLRSAMSEACLAAELSLYIPSLQLCTDNAAMIAACGYQRYRRGISSELEVAADPNLPLA